MSSFRSIIDQAAAERSDQPLFVFPETRWRGEEVLTYGELASKSTAAARAIAEHAHPGDRALLLFATGAAFWEAFVGCLTSGVIAVPLSIPNFNRSSDALQEVCGDCSPSLLVADEQTAELLERRAEKHPTLCRLPRLTPARWRGVSGMPDSTSPADEDIAFLQYTSGSTARPKGVQVSHGNLLANLAFIRDRMEIKEGEDSGVTWLPHHHDMGLVGSCLTTLFTKNTTLCLPPEEFVLYPARWLQLISAQRASICGGPDFAFRLCAEKINDDQIEGVDLSSWRVAYVGSERVRAETLRRFTDRFSRIGFRQTSFFPCYGLGEATLMATGGPANRRPVVREVSLAALTANRVETPASPEDCTSLVGSGQACEECKVLILDRDTRQRLPEGRIGEVYLSGPSVTRGYFNRRDLNDRLFHEALVDGRPGSFLPTGDLGFLSAGELFITGRTREIIIIRGRNLSPEDIEQQVDGAHEALQPGGAVAFGADLNGTESLVIAAELKRSAMRSAPREVIIRAIRNRVVECFEVNPAEILLLRLASIPRTTSGKPKRLVVREQFLRGALEYLTGEET